MNQQPGQTHHNIRFYIVMTTIVIGGIFVLLLLNNNYHGFTSAFVSNVDGENTDQTETTEGSSFQTDSGSASGSGIKQTISNKLKTSRDSTTTTSKGSHDVQLSLDFNQIPQYKKETRIATLELIFDDVNTKINVNNDRLELNNLPEVTLLIEGFNGQTAFDSIGLSLAGTASRIEINGVALAAKKDLQISFEDLDYKRAHFGNAKLDTVRLPVGSGKMNVEQRLSYLLDQESVGLQTFLGDLGIDKVNGVSVNFNGVARGIDVGGQDLSLSLR